MNNPILNNKILVRLNENNFLFIYLNIHFLKN